MTVPPARRDPQHSEKHMQMTTGRKPSGINKAHPRSLALLIFTPVARDCASTRMGGATTGKDLGTRTIKVQVGVWRQKQGKAPDLGEGVEKVRDGAGLGAGTCQGQGDVGTRP